MQATGSNLGSLYPFVQSQAVQGEFPLSFLNDRFSNLESWRNEARANAFALLHYAPPRCDFRVEVLERKDCGDFIREKIQFNTTPHNRVPAYVLVPKNLKGRAPAIVALHDHGGFYMWGKEKLVATENEHPELTRFKEAYAERSIAAELAKQGYVVVVIDMYYWGERRMLLDDDPADFRNRDHTLSPERLKEFNRRCSQNEQLNARALLSAGITWPGVIFWDDIRTIDYLASRPEVDPDRIGCVGLSVGAVRSGHLAALDGRIKAAVVVGWMTSFPYQLKTHIPSAGFTKLIPGMYGKMDYPDVISMTMPSALLVINGTQDRLFNLDGVKASFDKLTRCYKKAGIPEKFRGSLYDAPHEFNAQMQEEAWAWLKKWV